jgi:hypothetical protein
MKEGPNVWCSENGHTREKWTRSVLSVFGSRGWIEFLKFRYLGSSRVSEDGDGDQASKRRNLSMLVYRAETVYKYILLAIFSFQCTLLVFALRP